jgi:hypothetical protein
MPGLISFLCTATDSMSGDRYGTHPGENFIGPVRRLSVNYDSLDNVLRIIAKSAIAGRFMNGFGKVLEHRERENRWQKAIPETGLVSNLPCYSDFTPDFNERVHASPREYALFPA